MRDKGMALWVRPFVMPKRLVVAMSQDATIVITLNGPITPLMMRLPRTQNRIEGRWMLSAYQIRHVCSVKQPSSLRVVHPYHCCDILSPLDWNTGHVVDSGEPGSPSLPKITVKLQQWTQVKQLLMLHAALSMCAESLIVLVYQYLDDVNTLVNGRDYDQDMLSASTMSCYSCALGSCGVSVE